MLNGPVEIWPDYLFLAFTIIKHSPSPQFGSFVHLYQIVSGISIINLTAPPHNGILPGKGSPGISNIS